MKLSTGQVAVVTGAAHGVGLSLTHALLAKGLKVVMIDRDRQALASLEPKLQSEGTVSAYECDITDTTAVESVRQKIVARHGKIHLLINNAGVSVDAPFGDHLLDDFRWVLETNLMGAVHMCKYFLDHLTSQGGGHIVNVASAAAIFGFPRKTAYCASKFGLKGFSQALRIELHRQKVGVTIAYLGPVRTKMISRSRVADDKQRLKMQAYLDKKGSEPMQVAAEILRAIEQNRGSILVSSQSRALHWLDRIVPNSFLSLLVRFQDRLPA